MAFHENATGILRDLDFSYYIKGTGTVTTTIETKDGGSFSEILKNVKIIDYSVWTLVNPEDLGWLDIDHCPDDYPGISGDGVGDYETLQASDNDNRTNWDAINSNCGVTALRQGDFNMDYIDIQFDGDIEISNVYINGVIYLADGVDPGTMANVNRGHTDWVDVNNAKVSDGTYASVVLDGDSSDYLAASNFGFEIPVGATIKGIEVSYEGKTLATEINVTFFTDIFKDVTNIVGTKGNDEIGNINTVEQYYVKGSPVWLWALTLTPEEVNDSGFGCFVYASNITTDTISIDNIRMKVYYSPAVSPLPSFNR